MATDHFVSFVKRQVPGGEQMLGAIHSGTSSTGADFLELRWQEDTGSGATGVTKKDVILFLEWCEGWIKRGGLLENGTDVPSI